MPYGGSVSEGGNIPWQQSQQSQVQYAEDGDVEMSTGGGRKSGEMTVKKWEEEEALLNKATISSILYANIKYPQLRNEIPG